MDVGQKGMFFPLRLGPDRGLDIADVDATVRAMLLSILLTHPGERVNRPTFGVGAQDAVFEPNGPILAAKLLSAVEDNVHAYLDTDVHILDVALTQADSDLVIRISYEIIGTAAGPHDIEVLVPMEIIL